MAMDQAEYPEWQAAIQRLAAEAARVIAIGPTDAGKTTFCALLANAALALNRRVSVIDSDIGQSEIGPPTCVGLTRVQRSIRSLGELPPVALGFVGSTSPRGCGLELATAVRSLTSAAERHDPAPDLVIVDTTGYVQGLDAVRLKQAKIELLEPSHVVAIQRGRECEAVVAPLQRQGRIAVERLPVAGAIARKSPSIRAQRRAAKLARYFEGAELCRFDFDQVAFVGTWINTAPALPPHVLDYLSRGIGAHVFYAEDYERHVGLVTAGPVPDSALGILHEQLRPQAVTVTPVARLRHLLVGLCDCEGSTLGLGLIEAFESRRRRIGVLTPLRGYAAVRVIRFGLLRVDASGRELGANRPGDV